MSDQRSSNKNLAHFGSGFNSSQKYLQERTHEESKEPDKSYQNEVFFTFENDDTEPRISNPDFSDKKTPILDEHKPTNESLQVVD